MNLFPLGPELSLLATAVVVLFVDLVYKSRTAAMALSLAGVLIAGIFSAALWSQAPQIIFNNMLAVDNFAIFFKFIVLAALALVILASHDFNERFQGAVGEYCALLLMSGIGLMLLSSAQEMISIYTSLELSGVSLYVLAAYTRDSRSSEAGLKYVLLGSVASAVLLYGMVFIYGLTGETELTRIAAAVQSLRPGSIVDNPALLLGMVLIVAGFGFKISSFPFQMWVPDVYEGAPTPITGYLSAASKAAGFAVVLRIFTNAFGGPAWLNQNWGMMFAVLAALTMTFGNLVAIAQANIKRMMAYSSIAQAGYMMVGLAAASGAELLAGEARGALAFFLASYTLTNVGAFIAIIAFSNKTGTDNISEYSGMGKRAPMLAIGLTVCLVSLVGLPPTAGLIAKIYLFNAAVQQGFVWLVLIGVINTVISAYYYLRVVKLMWLGAPASDEPVPSSASLRTALTLACAGVLLLGILPALLAALSRTAGLSFS
ncbi:MAG: NADH-quinone oxidoreductase subunit N [Chloroflexi bacterium]|nr:NADH-quinone oxidoreductase subunit N [Chloroflexota bacterium]